MGPVEGAAAEGLDPRQPFDLIAEELDAQDTVVVGRANLHRIAHGPEGPVVRVDILARVLDGHQPAQEVVPFKLLSHAQTDHVLLEGVGIAHAVDRRHARHHDHVAPANRLLVARRRNRSISSLMLVSFSM